MNQQRAWPRAPRPGRAGALCLVLVLAGCASKGTVSGTITYKGKPIPSGNVTFFPANGAPVVAAITDGKYTAEKVPAGTARVAVKSLGGDGGRNFGNVGAVRMKDMKPPDDVSLPPEARKMLENRAGQAKKGVKIPEDYNDPDKSGLTCTVTGGPQTWDIDLK